MRKTYSFKTKMTGGRNCQHIVTIERHKGEDTVYMRKYYFAHPEDDINERNRKIIRQFSWGTFVCESIVYRISTLCFIAQESLKLFSELENTPPTS